MSYKIFGTLDTSNLAWDLFFSCSAVPPCTGFFFFFFLKMYVGKPGGGGGYCHISAIQVCAAVKDMVFKQLL